MNKIYITIFILTLLLQLSESVTDSLTRKSYSKLIGMVRKEIVDKALANFPKRDEIDVLQMLIQLKNAKEKYSLNDADSAYFIYKWITQNFRANGVEEDLAKIYKSGKGTRAGLSSLFKRMCSYLDLESDLIPGILRYARGEMEYVWNYVVIDGEYYLLDVATVIEFNYMPGQLFDKDIFFGTEPEAFIRFHYPKEKKWQLLSEPYTLEKFQSLTVLSPIFFMLNLKSVSPDTNNLKKIGTISFTYDESIQISNIQFFSLISEHDIDAEFNITNGKVEIKYNLDDMSDKTFLGINIKIKNFDEYVPIIYYRLDNSMKSS